MEKPVTPEILLIGVGNEMRGDDAVGLLIARRIQALNLPGVSVFEWRRETSGLLEFWKNVPAVVLVDAVYSKNPPGTLHRWDACSKSLPADYFAASSHSVGVAQAVELARVLHQLPPRLIVYGVEARQFDIQSGLSPELEGVLDLLVQRIQMDLPQFREGETPSSLRTI
jgi:hydrogenase maturation protease